MAVTTEQVTRLEDRVGRQEGRHKACPYGGGGLVKTG